MNRRNHPSIQINRTAKSIFAANGIKMTETTEQDAARVIVYVASDPLAHDEALHIQERYGGILLPVDSLVPYPADEAAGRARRAFESAWFMAAPLDMPAETRTLVDDADIITLVASIWNKHLAAPLATFLERQTVSQPVVELRALAASDDIAPVFYREICERLPRGAQVSVSTLDERCDLALVADGRRIEGDEGEHVRRAA